MGQIPPKYFMPSAPYGASENTNVLNPAQKAAVNPQQPLLPTSFGQQNMLPQNQQSNTINPFYGLFALLVLLFAAPAFATTTVTGKIQNLGTGNVTSGAFVRFWLRGCAGNQPRVNGTSIIGPTQGGVFFFDISADSSGNISGTLYSTRDAAGTGNGEIECGGSKTAVWYGMQTFVAGRGGPEIPVHAQNGVMLDITSVTPITTSPVVIPPGGPTASTLAIKPAVSDAIQYVSPNGNDANDGLSMGTAKLTPAAAIAVCPATGCHIYILGRGMTFTTGLLITNPSVYIDCLGDDQSGNLTTLTYSPSGTGTWAITVTYAGSSFGFKNCGLTQGNSTANTGGLLTQGIQKSTVEFDEIYGFTGDAWKLTDVAGASTIYNTCRGTRLIGTASSPAALELAQSNSGKVINENQFDECVYISNNASGNSIKISGNSSENKFTGDVSGNASTLVLNGDGVNLARENKFEVTMEGAAANQIGINNQGQATWIRAEGALSGTGTPVPVQDNNGGTHIYIQGSSLTTHGIGWDSTLPPMRWLINGAIGLASANPLPGLLPSVNAPTGWSLCGSGSCKVSILDTGIAYASPLSTKSSPYTLTASDSWINVTGTTTITVPHALTGQRWHVKNTGTAIVTLVPDSGNLDGLSGAPWLPLLPQNSTELTCDGTNCQTGLTFPYTMGEVNLTGRTANLGPTTIGLGVPAGGGGMYRASCYVVETTNAGTSSTLPQCNILFTDSDSSVAENFQLTSTNAGNTVGSTGLSGSFVGSAVFNAQAATTIQYQTSGYASNPATVMQYAIHIRLEYLGP